MTQLIGLSLEGPVFEIESFQRKDEALRAVEERGARGAGAWFEFGAGGGEDEAETTEEGGVEVSLADSPGEGVGLLLGGGEGGVFRGRWFDGGKGGVGGGDFGEEPGEGLPLREGLIVGGGVADQFPTGFAEGNGLADKPGAGSGAGGVAPVFGLVDGLTVEFEEEVGVAGGGEVGIDVLMAGDAGVGADVETFEVAQAGANAGGVGPIGAGVTAEPGAGSAVAAFAGDGLLRLDGGEALGGGDGLEGGVAGGAAGAGLGGGKGEGIGDALGAGVGEDGVAAGVEVALLPGDELAAFFAGAAVATGGAAIGGADEAGGFEWALGGLDGERGGKEGEEERGAEESVHGEKCKMAGKGAAMIFGAGSVERNGFPARTGRS